MENALIVAASPKITTALKGMLAKASIGDVTVLSSCAEARRLLLDRTFDLVVISALLKDETGEALAKDISALDSSQVILLVKNEFFEETAHACEEYGILTIAKPFNPSTFWSALQLAKSVHHKLKNIHTQNTQLKQKIQDIRVIDRAKCVLIAHFTMEEQEAHRYIEKQAMDTRSSKRVVADEIIKNYDN